MTAVFSAPANGLNATYSAFFFWLDIFRLWFGWRLWRVNHAFQFIHEGAALSLDKASAGGVFNIIHPTPLLCRL
jgi:hypothetical protein